MYRNFINLHGIMTVKIITNNSTDPVLSNLVPGSFHQSVPAARNYALWDIAGVWVKGTDKEPHLLPCKQGSPVAYEIVKP